MIFTTQILQPRAVFELSFYIEERLMLEITVEYIMCLSHVMQALLILGFFKSIYSLITRPLCIHPITNDRRHHEKSYF